MRPAEEIKSVKPPLPARMYEPFPRIDVHEAPGSPFADVLRIAVSAADRWMLGPDGPYQHPGMSAADIVRGQLREALLHLCELGFIDIDSERMQAAKGWPMDRKSFRP
ncbi:hypothetical protein [Planobispora rosea]|uniref:hypothetical protein n=1 Tax=Planobispora rosea TaxID=35762 RepID=UPI00083AAC1F|nr:hypothetical protein [Planobispora rosea]